VTHPSEVLVVEDDERSAALIDAMLAAGGYRSRRAASIAEARASLALGLPEVALLDLRLPDGSGTTIAREIRSMPAADTVLILAVTASVLEAVRRDALDSGCDGFVEKPISPRDLLARIEQGRRARAFR
jgi:two-component system cell cycle response regulator DivK